MTLKMPSIDGFPSYIVDQYASTGIIPMLRRPLSVKYSADTLDVTVPDHTVPTPYDGGTDPLDESTSRHVLFVDNDGKFWSIEQSRLQFLQTLSATFYIMFRRTANGWKRWQPRLGTPAPTLTTEWLIALVAGGSTMASFFGGYHGTLSAPVDGALGTNTLIGPQVMAFASDGKLWFLDGGLADVRTYDPATGLVVSAFFIPSATGDKTELGIALDGDDNVWIYYRIDADSPFAVIQGFTPDGATVIGGLGSGGPGGSPLPGTPSAISFSPDFTRLYLGGGFSDGSGIYSFNRVDALVTGSGVSSLDLVGMAPGNTIGVWADANDNVYSVSYEAGAAAKVSFVSGVVNLTNLASGQGFSGDGEPAFTISDDTPQFNHSTAIAYDPVTKTIAIVDRDNFAIRAILSDTNLYTIAGIPLLSGSGLGNYPTPTPANARQKYLGGSPNSIIPKPGGGFYICVGSDFSETDEDTDGMWAIYSLVPGHKECMSLTPTIRLVAGGVNSSDGIQVDGALGTNICEGIHQMCWGPDGKIWFVGGGNFVRTYDPVTGLVATTPFTPIFSTSGLRGLCFTNTGKLYILALGNDDSSTGFITLIPAGATDMTGASEVVFLSMLFGSASLVGSLAVQTNETDEDFLFFNHYGFDTIMMYDTITNILYQSFIGNGVEPRSADSTTQDVGEGVLGSEASLGINTVGFFMTRFGNIVTGSYDNQMLRAITPGFVTGDGGRRMPGNEPIHSVTNHSLDRGRGYGGDNVIAFELGNYGPQFNGVSAVAVDDCGNYFCIDADNYRIRMVDASGILHTIAGDGTSGFAGTGSGPLATTSALLATTISLGNSTGGFVDALLPDNTGVGGLYVATSGAMSGIMKLEV